MAYILFGVRFKPHCIHCVYRHSGVDRKDKLSTFVRCVYVDIDRKLSFFSFL